MGYVITAIICLAIGFAAGYLVRRNNDKDPKVTIRA